MSSLAPDIQVGTVGRNVALQFTDRLVRLSVGFVVNVWIVRYLGPDGVGLLGFAQSLVAFAAIAAEIGLESILIRELVRRPGDAQSLLATGAAMRLAGSAVAMLLAGGTVLLLRPGDQSAFALVLVLASVTCFQAMDVVGFWFQSRARFAPLLIARGAAFLVASAAKIGCLVAGASLEQLAVAIALEGWLAALALALAYRWGGGTWRGWRVDMAEAARLWHGAWPLMLNSAALVAAARFDQVIITQLRGPAENGLYAAAQRLFEIVHIIPAAVAAAVAPELIRAHARSRDAHLEQLARLFQRLVWAAIAIAAVVSSLSGWIVPRLFGEAFRASGPVLALLVWAAPALFLGVAQSNWFIVERDTRGLLVRSAVAAIVLVGLDLLLVPRYGARGAAMAVIIANTLAYIGVNALVRETRPLFRLQLRALVPWRSPAPGSKP